jgi:hypothetical protein
MFHVEESSNWSKRLRMSPFVQIGKMSFREVKPDAVPPEENRGKKFNILLRTGMFSIAQLVQSDHGGFVWHYPIHPIEWFGGDGVWVPDEVVAWQEKIR